MPDTMIHTEKTDRQAKVERGCDVARDQQFRLGYIADLLTATGREMDERNEEHTPLEWGQFALRVEFLADLVREHADTIGKALSTIESGSGLCVFGDQLPEDLSRETQP